MSRGCLAGRGSPIRGQSLKPFALGPTLIVGGCLLFGMGFGVQALGSLGSRSPEILGLVADVIGVVLAANELNVLQHTPGSIRAPPLLGRNPFIRRVASTAALLTESL